MTWPVVPLSQVADTALGKMLDKGKPKGHPHVPYLRNVNVQWGRIDTHDVLTMELGDSEHDRFGVEAGDLLVCEGGEVGRCAIWNGSSSYMAFQKALHRIRVREALDAKFLRYLLEHHATSGVLARMATGSTIAHLPQQQLRRVPVPLPPIEEQRRIVDILEDHTSRLDAAERELSSVTWRLEHIGEAALRSLVADDVVERPLADVLELPLSNGRSVPTRLNGFPVLRLTALKDEGVDLGERKGGDWTEVDAQRFLVRRGDYLIARGNGSLHRVGRGSLVRDEPDPVAYPDTAIRARPAPSVMTPEFLDVVWNSSRTRGQIEGMARTTAGIYKVNQKQLDSVQLPVPSLNVQDAVVRRMGEVDQQAQRTLEAVAAARQRSKVLRSSLLAAAFEGKLTGHSSGRDMAEAYVSV